MKNQLLVVIGICAVSIVLLSIVIFGDKTIENAEPLNIDYQQVELSHDGTQLVPRNTVLSTDKSYKIVINPSSNGKGCMSTIKRKGTQKPYLIMKWEPITLTLDKPEAGIYKLVCAGMGMEQGSITIQ